MKRIEQKFSRYLLALFICCQMGCSKRYSDLPAFSAFPFRDSYNYSAGRFKTSYLADQIHAYYRGKSGGPIAVATFVDIDNLYTSSTFGRLLGEQLMSELAMKGYNVIEMRQSEALQVMSDQGEFGLSRDVSTLRNSQNVSGLVVGTYTVSPLRVYINARLIDPNSSLVISAGSVEMAKTGEIDRLLRNNTLPATLERIPVRHLSSNLSNSAYVLNAPTKKIVQQTTETIEQEKALALPPTPKRERIPEPDLGS